MSLLVFQPVFWLQLYTPYFSAPSPHHMSIPSQPTTFNDSCDRLNSNHLSQFFTCPSVFHGNTTQPSNHQAISAGGLSSACLHQSNLRKLTKGKLLMKHTYTILTLGCGSLRHLGPGDQVPEIQQMVPGVNQRKDIEGVL